MSACPVCGIEKRGTCHAEYESRIAELEAERDDEKASRELWWEKCQQAAAEVARLNAICDRLAAAGHSDP